jgi:drug/metabolite transporter (DMT)-like permease
VKREASASQHPSAATLYLMIAFMIVSWALNFVIGKVALREIPSMVLPGMRIAIAFLCFIPIYLWDRPHHKKTPFRRADIGKLILISICGITFNQFFFIAGLERTSVAHMAVFISLTPVLVLLIAAAIGQEKITAPKLIGMLVAMAGVLSIELSAGGESRIATPLGDLFGFLCTLSFAIYTVAGRDLGARYGSIPMNLLMHGIGAITLLPLAFMNRGSFHLSQVSTTGWMSLGYMVVFSSVCAYLIFYYALMHIPASRVAAFTYAEPVLAAILGFAILGEPVTWILGIGGALVLAGVWVAERA